ncbi:hypothetical protein [Streptomyces sp. H27-C3]|uniref:hypothetical protein n=1 Tax=Streptomyces sp. H27-C3 TaxID=3046305 RepID=UPI0024B921DC|nr:hypothetical protein [Streptomyces sp. H27-C3]MDJ0464068.1 hypothetical protein [Streptomyces sp. H27-C3]
MRLLRRLAVACGAALATALLCAPPAAAADPTSLLLTSPVSGEAHAVHRSSGTYAELEKHLGTGEPGGVPKRPPVVDKPADEGGTWRRITVTWLVHDVSVWRVDRIHVPKSGGPVWVSTVTDSGSPAVERWHLADAPARLHSLLGRLGVLGRAKGDPAATGNYVGEADHPPDFASPGVPGPAAVAPGDPAPVPGPPSSASPAATAPAGSGGGTSRWWAVPGLAAGILTGLAGATLFRRRRAPRGSGPPEPRGQLIDL